jgi:NAD(P)H-flavin reductase
MIPRIFDSKVIDVSYETPRVLHLRYSLPRDFDFKPGQYLSLSVIHEGKKFRSPFSIATFPNNRKHADFYIKLSENGRTSNFAKSLKKGDEIELFGPLGKFAVSGGSKERDIAFLSSGTGITAFMSMIPSLLADGDYGKKVILLKGFRNEEDVLYEKECLKLGKKHGNFEFHNVLSRPKNGDFPDKGYVQDFLEKYLPGNFDGDFYLCGLKEMVAGARDKLIGMGVDGKRIFSEEYD